MARKQKQKQKQRDKLQRGRKQRRERRKAAGQGRQPARPREAKAVLSPAPERCLPPVFIDASRRVVEDPLDTLGLEGEPTPEAARAAWRERILERPPEQHPEEAEALREARDRLIDPERRLERALGVLHIPDPAAFGLSGEAAAGEARLPAMNRLMGQAVLYALVEEELAGADLAALYKGR
jgi:hypothetical protein